MPTSVLVRRRGEGHDMSVIADPAFGLKPIIERGSSSWLAGDFSKLGIEVKSLPIQCTGQFLFFLLATYEAVDITYLMNQKRALFNFSPVGQHQKIVIIL